MDEAYISASLQVAHALFQDGCEDAPDLRLAGGLALVQQLHHALDALRFLDDEVHLQVKMSANQLRSKEQTFIIQNAERGLCKTAGVTKALRYT